MFITNRSERVIAISQTHLPTQTKLHGIFYLLAWTQGFT